jgi:hypothetical protein
MHNVIIDYVRSRQAERHGGEYERITLDTGIADQPFQAPDLLPAIERSVARPDLQDEEAAAHMLLGVALSHSGQPTATRPHLQRAVATREKLDAPESPWLSEARRCLEEY